MSRLARNLVSNFAASATSALIALFVIPLYIRFLGMEAYGLIAFYLALWPALQILDLGLGSVVNREMARSRAGVASGDSRDALRTFEFAYWGVGVASGAAIVLAAPAIATHWITAGSFAPWRVTAIVRLIGVLIAIQWPATYYQHALLGLERQLVLNAIRIATAVLTHAGAILVIAFGWRSVEAFFFCAVAANAAQTLVLAALLLRWIAASERGAFRIGALRHIGRFTAAVTAISVSGTFIGQVDKLVLSVLFPLALFAHYSLATMVAGALTILATPIFHTFYPRFSSLAASGHDSEMRELHHFGSQLMTVAVMPVALIVMFFARELIGVWTGSAATAAAVAPVAVLLTGAAALNGMMTLLYAQQLARGWTRVAVAFAVSGALAYVPLLTYAARRFGIVGGGASALLLNAAYFVIVAPLTFRRLMPGSFTTWLTKDILLPTLPAAAIVFGATHLHTLGDGAMRQLVLIAGTYVLALLASVAFAGRLRGWLAMRFRAGASARVS